MKKVFSLLLFFCAFLLNASAKNFAPSDPRTAAQDTTLRDIVYANSAFLDGSKQNLTMDIHFPPNMQKGKVYPMALMIHGGSFLTGNKEQMTSICRLMADSGFVTVTINYRLGWNAFTMLNGCSGLDVSSLILASYRAVQDAHAAMRFLTANAKKYHIDTDWMFIGGGSAGGVMALDVVYLNQASANKMMDGFSKNFADLDKDGNNLHDKFKIKGICNLWGALTDSTLINKQTALPTIFFHGTADNTVPYNRGYYIPNCTRVPELFGSACLYRQTIAAGQPAVLNTSIGGKHGPKEFTAAVIASNTACFFHQVMEGTAKSGAYTDAVVGCR